MKCVVGFYQRRRRRRDASTAASTTSTARDGRARLWASAWSTSTSPWCPA
ncbi:MAG: hypothetical protein MZW92_60355 [Comamonadaceae bacterium]|nr:hypothetical protein [Comamonadaceae bacterium]